LISETLDPGWFTFPFLLPAADITVFFVGMEQRIKVSMEGEEILADGFTADDQTCWVRGSSTEEYNKDEAENVIAHEIGHVIVGKGHPDANGGPAILQGSDDNARLMATRSSSAWTKAKLLVKEEWDAAQQWLTAKSHHQ